MHLVEERRRELINSTWEYLVKVPKPDGLVLLVGHEAAITAPQRDNEFRTAQWVVDWVLRRPSPDAFFNLLDLVDDPGVLPLLHALAARIQQQEEPWAGDPAPVELWHPRGKPFIDRTQLRSVLTEMAEGGGPGSVLIRGERGQGKRTLTSFVQKLADVDSSFVPICIELWPEPVPGVLQSLAMDLSLALEYDLEPSTTHQEPDRVGQVYANEIAYGALNALRPVWLVANLSDPDRLEPGLLAFVDGLLEAVTNNPEVATKLRILLLTDRLNLGLPHAPAVSFTLQDIELHDVTSWFEAVIPGRPPILYAQTAARVFQWVETRRVPASGRLEYLAYQCAKSHRVLAASGLPSVWAP